MLINNDWVGCMDRCSCRKRMSPYLDKFCYDRPWYKCYKILDATIKAFEGELATHRANLQVYLNNSAGVGEHSDIIGEIKDLVQKIHDTNGCIEILINHTEEF